MPDPQKRNPADKYTDAVLARAFIYLAAAVKEAYCVESVEATLPHVVSDARALAGRRGLELTAMDDILDAITGALHA